MTWKLNWPLIGLLTVSAFFSTMAIMGVLDTIRALGRLVSGL